MSETVDQFEIGDRCRLRDRNESGMISFIDFSGGWARIEWDEQFREDMPVMWHLDSLEAEEETPIEQQASWGVSRLKKAETEEAPERPPVVAGFWKTVFRTWIGRV